MLHHRNVLTLLGFTHGFDLHCRLPSLVSPWMPNGTSRDYLKDQSKLERIRIVSCISCRRNYSDACFAQLTGVADGLCYLHRHDVVHGDLKGVRSFSHSMSYMPMLIIFNDRTIS